VTADSAVQRRELTPNELDHELIWLTVSLGSLACAAAWLGFGLPWPRCVFHQLTGLPCVTCGMTRSAIAFFHGHLIDAWSWNPLVFVILCGLSIFDVYAFAVVITGAPRLRTNFSPTFKNCARAAVIAALALNWIYLLLQWRKF
jgi:Protein of unknown function (DUF2752)